MPLCTAVLNPAVLTEKKEAVGEMQLFVGAGYEYAGIMLRGWWIRAGRGRGAG